MGGFTSAPPVFAAKDLGVKTFLHESNTIPGKANRFLARFVDEAFVLRQIFHRPDNGRITILRRFVFWLTDGKDRGRKPLAPQFGHLAIAKGLGERGKALEKIRASGHGKDLPANAGLGKRQLARQSLPRIGSFHARVLLSKVE
jgi:hypothetical protein